MVEVPPITDDQYYAIIALIADCKSITTACSETGISTASFYKYKRIVGDVAEKEYARAIEERAISRVENIEKICDECENEIRTIKDPKRTGAIAQAYRMRVDAIKWQVSKEYPKVFGDKLQTENNHTGLPPIPVITQFCPGMLQDDGK